MSRPPQPPWFKHPNNIRWRIQVMKFIVMKITSRSVFLPFRSKYPPQHSVLKSLQSMFLPQYEKSSFAPIQQKWKNYSLHVLIFRFFIWCGKTRFPAWGLGVGLTTPHRNNFSCYEMFQSASDTLYGKGNSNGKFVPVF
jgi:hypothetical protein